MFLGQSMNEKPETQEQAVNSGKGKSAPVGARRCQGHVRQASVQVPGIENAGGAIDDTRGVMRQILVAWLFGAAWMSITTGAALTRFARGLGVGEFGFGLMAAIPFVAALGQLPGSFILERYGHRKLFFLVGNLIHRGLWLVIALIPWVVPSGSGPVALILLMALSATLGNVVGPCWYSWLLDLVPSRIRARFISRRVQAGQMVSLTLTMITGVMLDYAERTSGLALSRMLSVLLAAAAIPGIIDILYFLPVPSRQVQGHNHHFGMRNLFREPLANRSFRWYLVFTAMLTFSTGFMGQFTWLYVFDVVNVSNLMANILLIALPQLVALSSAPFWGRMIDRLGRKPVAIIAGAGMVHGAVVWIFVSEGHLFPGYAGILLAAFAWPGLELASYNILLGLVERKAGTAKNTAYVAINSVVVAVAGLLSGLFGGVLAHNLKDWHGAWFGLPVTYHGILFLTSSVLRIVGLGAIMKIEEPGAFSTRSAFRHMAGEMYSNLQGALLMPVRLAKWSYKVKLPKKR